MNKSQEHNCMTRGSPALAVCYFSAVRLSLPRLQVIQREKGSGQRLVDFATRHGPTYTSRDRHETDDDGRVMKQRNG